VSGQLNSLATLPPEKKTLVTIIHCIGGWRIHLVINAGTNIFFAQMVIIFPDKVWPF